MADLPFTKPDGSKVWVPEASQSAALEAGYRPGGAPEEANEPVRAGLESAARTATFGLSDPLLVGLGVNRKSLKAREEENPTASTIGSAAALFAPGGLPSKLSSATAKLAGKSLARKAAVYAGEGSLYGLGTSISEAALGDPNVNGERVAANMVAPALLGAGLAGVTHGLGKGATALLKNLGGSALASDLENAALKARKSVLEAQAIDKKALKEYNFDGRVEDAIEWADRKGVFAGNSHESVAELAGREVQKASADLEDIESTLQRIAEPDLPKLVDALRQRAGAMSNTVTGEKQSGLLSDLADAFEARMKVTPDGEAVQTYQPPTRANAHYELPGSVPESMRDQRLFGGMSIPGEAGEVSHGFSWTDLREELRRLSDESGPIDSKGRKGVLKEARGVIRNEVEAQMRSVAPALGDAWERSFQEMGYGLSIAKSATRKAAAGAGRGLGDEIGGLAGTLAFSGMGSIPGLIGGRVVQRFAQQRGGYLLADALRHIGDSKMISKMAGQLEKTINNALVNTPSMLGPYRGALELAASRGTNALFSTHMALASSENGHDYLARLGLEHEDPQTVQAYGQRLAVLSAIDAHSDPTGKVVNQFFSGGAPKKAPVAARSAKEMLAQIKNIDQLLLDPAGAASMVDPALYANAPGTGGVAIATLDRALRVLQSAAPRDPKSFLPPSLRPAWKPNSTQIDTWYDTLEAVQNPAYVFERMKHGEVPATSVQAVKLVYPQLFEATRQQMLAKVMEARKPVTYKQRLALASVFGPEFLGISAAQAMMYQSVHKKNEAASEQQQEQPQGASPDGRQMVDSAKNMQTQTQRIESR